MANENDKIALRTALHAERENNASLHRLLLDIREAAGDQHARLMQDDLVAHIAQARKKASRASDDRAMDISRNVMQARKEWAAQASGETNALIEQRDALAAHVAALHTLTFEADEHESGSTEQQVAFNRLFEEVAQHNGAPSLSRRDARMKAEALMAYAQKLGGTDQELAEIEAAQ